MVTNEVNDLFVQNLYNVSTLSKGVRYHIVVSAEALKDSSMEQCIEKTLLKRIKKAESL